jgi:hypothetical protein
MALVTLLLMILSTLAQDIPAEIVWKTGQVLAVSQREAEPSTVIFEFVTGSRYGHVGLVIIEDGKPVVYEATHPNVKKTSLDDFFSRVSVNSSNQREFTLLEPAMDLDPLEEANLKKFVHKHVSDKTPYNYNGVRTTGRLNCSEFVHDSFKAAGLPQLGHPQEARELNFGALGGRLKKLMGKKTIAQDALIISPFSVVNSPWMNRTYSTLPYQRVLSDKELYEEWKSSPSYKNFLDRFSITEDFFQDIEKDLSKTPSARAPLSCNQYLM